MQEPQNVLQGVIDQIEELGIELARQTQKHKTLPHNNLLCQAILSEECGEVARAILDAAPTNEHLKEELLQVACFALRWRGAL